MLNYYKIHLLRRNYKRRFKASLFVAIRRPFHTLNLLNVCGYNKKIFKYKSKYIIRYFLFEEILSLKLYIHVASF